MFNLDILELMQKSKQELNKICAGNYNRFWRAKISISTKAASFNKFKNDIALEKHLHVNFNLKHKIALSRFRLSNHPLMIEKGMKENVTFVKIKSKMKGTFGSIVLFTVHKTKS